LKNELSIPELVDFSLDEILSKTVEELER